MTTTLAARTDRAVEPIRPQRLPRLLSVELRKLVDVRSGRLLLALSVLIAVAGLSWMLIKIKEPSTFGDYAGVLQGVSMVLPLIGLLSMTAEWTQRTALSTFTLSPRRGRVLLAKFVASLILALAVFVVVMALVLAATYLAAAIHGYPADLDGMWNTMRSMGIALVLQVLMAAGFGALLAQTAAAVAAFLLAPTVVTVLAVQLLGTNGKWIDVFSAYERLASDHPWQDLGATCTAVGLWVLLPLAVGVVRSLRREVK